MNYEEKRKLLLKKCINSLDDKKLSKAIKEIADDDIDLLYSRYVLDKFIFLDETLEQEIQKLDDEESEKIFLQIRNELLKRKHVILTRQFSYSDDNGVVDEDNSFLLLINKTYELIKKLNENHSYEKAKNIISLLKKINIAYEYDLKVDEILIDETNKDELDNYDFYPFLECFYEIPYDFTVHDLADEELFIALHEKNSEKEVAKLVKEYAHQTYFNFAYIDKYLNLNKEEFVDFLFALFKEIKNKKDTYSTYFESINKVEINLSPLLDKIHHEIGKCNEVINALES